MSPKQIKKHKFFYLAQGRAEQIKRFRQQLSKESKLLTLTYDKQIGENEMDWDGNLYRPGTTWAEGRNLLLQEISREHLSEDWYIIIADDDVAFVGCSHRDLEQEIRLTNPDIAIPLTDTIKSSFRYNPLRRRERPVALDQCIQVFHINLLNNGNILPYETCLDSESWWCSCEINQFAIVNSHNLGVVQFNSIYCKNLIQNSSSDFKIDSESKYQGGYSGKNVSLVSQYIKYRFNVSDNALMSPFDTNSSRHIHPIQAFTSITAFVSAPSRQSAKTSIIYLYKLYLTLLDVATGKTALKGNCL